MNREGCFSVAVQASVQISWLVSWEPAQQQNLGILWHWKRIKKLGRNIPLEIADKVVWSLLTCLCESEEMHACSWIYCWLVTFTFLGVHLGLEVHPQTRLPSCVENSSNCEKRNGKTLPFSSRLLKFTQFLECFLILAELREGLPCVRSLGNIPCAAQWHSKGFFPAVAAAGLGRLHPGWFARGKRAGRRSWGERPINTAWLQLCCSLNRVTAATVHSAKMSHPFTAQHWTGWKSPTAPLAWSHPGIF